MQACEHVHMTPGKDTFVSSSSITAFPKNYITCMAVTKGSGVNTCICMSVCPQVMEVSGRD